MKSLISFLYILSLFLLSCHQKKDVEPQLLAKTEAHIIKELPSTLLLSDFGLYFTNWPKHWVLANHGTGCKPWNNSAAFMFGSRSTTEGTFQIETSEDLEDDYFSTLELVKRDVWNDTNSVDLFLESVDGGKVKIEFFNLNRKYENWVLENLAFLPPVEKTEIQEVSFPKFPILAPQKNQQINVLVGFDVLTSDRNYQITFQNAVSRLGVSCILRKDVKGRVTTSLGSSPKRMDNGDFITITAEEESVVWKVKIEKERIVIAEEEKGIAKNLFEVPIAKDYDFSFYAQED